MQRIWKHGWKIAVIAVAVIAIPTAALAATGAFTSTTATPAVTGANSSAAANATGVLGTNTGGGLNTRYGVSGTADGPAGIGVNGTGLKYGVFSEGPLGVAPGSTLSCTRCVTGTDLANRSTKSYNLAPGADSTLLTIPADKPVQLTGVNLTVYNRGVASATLLRTGSGPAFLEWTGLESTAASAITQGFSATPGTHIVYLDYAHLVDVEVNDSTSIRIHNASGVQQTGNIVITW